MAFASMIAMGAGAASNATGAYFSASGQKAALNAQASIDDTNARLAELGAQAATQAGQREQQASMLKTARVKAAQKVALAANGIDATSASAVEQLTSTDLMGEIDRQAIATNAMRAAFGYENQALDSRNSALMRRTTARGINPTMAAVSSLLSDGGKVASSWYSFGKAGSFGGGSAGTAPSASGYTSSDIGKSNLFDFAKG